MASLTIDVPKSSSNSRPDNNSDSNNNNNSNNNNSSVVRLDKYDGLNTPTPPLDSKNNNNSNNSNGEVNVKKKKKRGGGKVKIKLNLPDNNNGKKLVDFVFEIGKDNPEALAEELFAAQTQMDLDLSSLSVETIAKNIRHSVDVAVNRRQSRAKTRNSSVLHNNARKRADTANTIFEVAGDKKLQTDPEYQKIYKKYNENVSKIYTQQRQRKHRKQESLLNSSQEDLDMLKKELEKILHKINSYTKVNEDNIKEKKKLTAKVRQDILMEAEAKKKAAMEAEAKKNLKQ